MSKGKNGNHWTSYWGFILATSGAAVGLGNIWKFPYIAGENGGGAFVLIYLACVLFIGLPLLVAEVMLGRRGRQNPAYAMANNAQESGASRKWGVVGGVNIIASFLILSYYSVIAGWALDYVFQALEGNFYKTTAQLVHREFNELIISPWELSLWHTVIIVATILVVSLGVERGLERAVRYLFPAMFAILLLLVGYSMDSGHFIEAMHFLFYPDYSKLSAHGILEAVGHAFFTLSLATGSIMMYGAYLPRNFSIIKTCFYVAFADTLIALLAGLAIFPIVFANGLTPGAGPGLIFKTLPLAFGHMPYGNFFALMFFVMLVFAAFTSTIAMLEPSVAWAIERFQMTRKKATLVLGVLIWSVGFLTVFSFNIMKDVRILGLSIFDFLDTLTASYMLPIGGVLIALFSAWRMKQEYCLDELVMKKGVFFWGWWVSLGIITPLAIGCIFLSVLGVF